MAGWKDGLIGAGLLLVGGVIGVTVAVKQPVDTPPREQAEKAAQAAADEEATAEDAQAEPAAPITGETHEGATPPPDFGR